MRALESCLYAVGVQRTGEGLIIEKSKEDNEDVEARENDLLYEFEDYRTWVVSESSGYQEIGARTFHYAVRVIALCRFLIGSGDPVAIILAKQLLRSGGSIGANVAEAKSAESRADFLHKLGIALKEARESEYWIRLLIEAGFVSGDKTESILDETDQIIAVLTAIIVKAKSKRKG